MTDRPLLDWLLQKFPATPKKRAKQWISAGRVTVNGVVIRKPHQIIPDPGAALQLRDRHALALDGGPRGWQIHPRVNLLYLDAALAIVNKGPGLLAVPAEPGELSALSILHDFLRGKLRAQDRGVDGRGHTLPPPYRQLEPLPVHRLDQYTSGVFCIATNPKARQALINQLKAHTMQRHYVAYVEGRLARRTGTWRNFLKPSADELRQLIVAQPDADTHEAITHYEVVREFRGGFTKLRLRLETGRKHQIRVQAAQAGVPLVGDRTYNPRPQLDFPRQALHAETLSLEHPEKTGVRLTWTAALPRDLAQLEHRLNARGGPA
jgi:23S rRNA pseudouridine1911/1915/1917 synthase